MQKILIWNNSCMRKNYIFWNQKSTCLISLDRLQCSLPLRDPNFQTEDVSSSMYLELYEDEHDWFHGYVMKQPVVI